MKKTLIIVGIALLFSLIAWFFLRDTSTTTPVATIPTGGSPFGTAGGDINIPALGTETVGETTAFDDQNISSEETLFRISNTPSAGFVVFARGGDTIVRYVDRGTGHISEVTLPKTGATTLAKKKITNNTLPKIYEAHFRSDGSSVLLRFLEGDTDVVKNTSLTLTAPKSTLASTSSPQATDALYTVAAANLRGGLSSILVGTGNSLYYVLKDNSSIGSSDFIGGSQRTLFSSAFNNWRLGKFGNNLLVYTKASATAAGYAYSLPSGGGSLTKLLGPLPGLTVVANNSGTRLLYSYNEGGIPKLFVKNLENNAVSEILPASLAEKCVWSTKNINVFFCGTPLGGLTSSEPDNWYLGITHFTDYLWRFDTVSESAQLVSEPKTEFDMDIDVSDLRVTTQEDFLVFINKRDQTLWAVRLQ
ncbi:MAG: hypothetical protein AAB780_02370 [Patescibacteria group bacterium]